MKRLLVLGFLLGVSLFSVGQENYFVPEGYRLDSVADYYLYEEDALKCLRAYVDAGILEEETAAHSQARAFGLLWLAGHPSVRLELSSDAMPFIKENAELLYIFMFGSALSYCKSDGDIDAVSLHLSGVEAVLKSAETNKEIKRLRSIKDIRKLKRKGKLKEWLASKID